MPGKPRKPPAGFLNLRKLSAEAKRRGIQISVTGLKAALARGKLTADASTRGYNPSPLFSTTRLDYWLSQSPRLNVSLPKGFTTTYELISEAQKINPKISLRHVQAFLASHTPSMSVPRWAGTYTEVHGKRRRLVFPKAVAKEFLTLVRQNRLAGLFLHEGGAKKKRTATAQTRKITVSAAKRPEKETIIKKTLPAAPTPRLVLSAADLQLKLKLPVVLLRIQMQEHSGETVLSRDEAARLLTVSHTVFDLLVNEGYLKPRPSGQFNVRDLAKVVQQMTP